MPEKSDLQPEDFKMFLEWLASESDAACQKYEEIRMRLVKLFVCRGCSDPDLLADETIDRVVVKIKQIKENFVGDSPIKYIYGVARNVHLEFLRQNQKEQTAAKLIRPSPDLIESPKSFCLDHCLNKLPDEQRRIFLDYYQNEDNSKKNVRRELAVQLNMDINALRVKIHRSRQFLQDCLQNCLEKK